MSGSKIIGMLLIFLSLGVGYLGFNKIEESSAKVNIFGLIKIDASDESGKQQGYLLIGLSVVLFIGGIFLANRGEKRA